MLQEPKILEILKKLDEKFKKKGEDITPYLEGLLYNNFLTYWDYIHLDTLLSLQNPKTNIPDEKIFIIYHQITELYFKLILLEMEQIAKQKKATAKYVTEKLKRINRYFQNLVQSFDVMVEGMGREDFLKFRLSLTPASGFQSAQYRMIEFCATDMVNLVDKNKRKLFADKESQNIEKMMEVIYWKHGATDAATGKKTLSLIQFEEQYTDKLIAHAKAYHTCNVWAVCCSLSQPMSKELVNELKMLDLNVNVNWPLSHYKSAVRYLQREPEDIAATGGTNWQKYLPPRFQKRIFYPSIWTEEELENWGKSWVESVL